MWVAGVDEAGRGPLAGPVLAAAVVLDPSRPIEGLADSKLLAPRRREVLADVIKDRARCWAIGRADVGDIDRLNILQATLLAMRRAVEALVPRADMALIDGNRAPSLHCLVHTVVRGDATVPAISAASILAKVARDAEMRALDAQFPGYGFAQHKGYATPGHLCALQRYGVSPVHRCSFAPVRRLLTR
ncbi:MAG: ribonuclease HII [Acidiferrobacterales bacterium]